MNWLQRLINQTGESTVPSRPVATPEWMRKDLRLPPWAAVADTHSHKVSLRVEVDTEAAMVEWLQLLDAPLDKLTQYWIECAYQCAKMDVQMAIAATDVDPRTAGKPAEFHFKRAPAFALANFPIGPAKTKVVDGQELTLRGIDLATRGREAREHYVRIRGRMPM